MSFQSRLILQKLKKACKNTDFPLIVDPVSKTIHPHGLSSPSVSYARHSEEIGSILNLLEKQGYITYQSDDHSVFSLEHSAIHLFQSDIESVIKTIIIPALVALITTVIIDLLKSM